MVANHVRLRAHTDMLRKVVIAPTADTVKHGVIGFLSRRRQLHHHTCRDGVDRMRRRSLMDDSERWPDKERDPLKAAVGELGSAGESLGKGIGWHCQFVRGRD